jgi:hypothetical protein
MSGMAFGFSLGLVTGGAPVAVFDAQAIITSVPFAFDYDVAVSARATGVSQLTNLSSGGAPMLQANPAKQPAYNASDAAFGGGPSATTDGVDDELVAALTVPLAGTTPRYYVLVARQLAWVSTRRLFGCPNTTHLLYQNLNSPELSLYNGGAANANNGLVVGGAPRVIEAYFSASASDFIRIGGGTPVTGASAGPGGGGTSWAIGAQNGSAFSSIAFTRAFATNGLPTVSERNAIVAALNARYSLS